MYIVALKMLVGDRAKYFGLVFGITFAALLMSQQVSLFFGVIGRTSNQIKDVSEADIWVMSPAIRYVDENDPLSSFDLYRVRGVPGVKWAVPLFKGAGVVKTSDGAIQAVTVIGVDDQTLIGKPPKMLHGRWEDLQRPDALIMDKAGWEFIWPGSTIELGRTVELNERRAQIVGICEASPPFMTLPMVFTQFSNALSYIPQGRKYTSFIVAKAEDNASPLEVARHISQKTQLQALSQDEFAQRSIDHYMKRTAIPINFGMTIALGFIVGAAIAAQTFYIFIIENIKQFGALKAIGVTNRQLLSMVAVQACVVAFIGFSIGIGLTALFFESTSHVDAMRGLYLRGSVMLGTAAAVVVIMLLASFVSLQKVFKLDPAIVFRG